MKLNLNEFSILNSAIVDGLKKYGGNINMSLNMAKENEEIFWTLTTDNQRVFQAVSYYLAEKSSDLIRNINVDHLDANGKIALKAMKSLSLKAEDARENPVWDPVKVSGVVSEEKENWYITGKTGKYQITGKMLSEIQKVRGKAVVAAGVVKTEGQFELAGFIEKRANTLELFVMSHCPFGQKAVSSMLNHLLNHSNESKPRLEIRYIFYKKNENGKEMFTALHGEKEIQENLVQMIIRDRYPRAFNDYLLMRASDMQSPWEKLASGSGLGEKKIRLIARTIETDREKLIREEYEYAVNTYQISDGSPTYVWESEIVTDISTIEPFKEINSANLAMNNCADH
jgi:hypothetical protein